jgi:hypothetical protein
MSKYHSKPVEYDGIRFDSIAEYGRYTDLKRLEQEGEITDLQVHPRYMLQEAFTRPDGGREAQITYVGDFQYVEHGKTIVEDVKGVRTEVYKIKRKLFLARYPEIKFMEVKA